MDKLMRVFLFFAALVVAVIHGDLCLLLFGVMHCCSPCSPTFGASSMFLF